MTETSAALIGSIATAVIGLIGVGIAQLVSWKTAKLRSKEDQVTSHGRQVAQGELPFESMPGSGLTGFALLRMDLEGLKLLMMRSHEETLLFLQTLSVQIQEQQCGCVARLDQKESS